MVRYFTSLFAIIVLVLSNTLLVTDALLLKIFLKTLSFLAVLGLTVTTVSRNVTSGLSFGLRNGSG